MWCPFSFNHEFMMGTTGYLLGWLTVIGFITFAVLVVVKLDKIFNAVNKKNDQRK